MINKYMEADSLLIYSNYKHGRILSLLIVTQYENLM